MEKKNQINKIVWYATSVFNVDAKHLRKKKPLNRHADEEVGSSVLVSTDTIATP